MFKKTFATGLVKSGSKSVNELNPRIILTSTNSAFKLNNKACALLNVEAGESTIGMFDMLGADFCESEETRYFVAGNIAEGAKLGKTRQFNYATIYNTMLNQEFGVTSIKNDDLVEKGLMIKREEEGKTPLYIANYQIECDLVQWGEEEVDLPGGDAGYVYAVQNFRVKEHTPRGGEGEEVEVVVEEEVED